MALKINITAQISNLDRLRRQIQEGLQNIQVGINSAGKANSQFSKDNIDNANAQLSRLQELNNELLKFIERKNISSKTQWDNPTFK